VYLNQRCYKLRYVAHQPAIKRMTHGKEERLSASKKQSK
jgi:hypothetical protein